MKMSIEVKEKELSGEHVQALLNSAMSTGMDLKNSKFNVKTWDDRDYTGDLNERYTPLTIESKYG